jgi:hypothetical protein
MFTRCLLSCASLLLMIDAAAQAPGNRVPTEADLTDVAATVWIAPVAGQAPVRLDRVDIRIDSVGFVARTRIELVFHNPNDRVLEGEFVFPLAAGQNVAGYALEVEGRMREGVVVPKQTARVAFEDITRQNIDPGLAELTAGNVFRTRLYPIPARGDKRIALTLEQAMLDEGPHYRYLLPLAFREPVGHFSVHVEAQQSSAGGKAASPDPALSFDRAGAAWVASFSRENVQPQRELAFRIPKPDAAATLLEAADLRDPRWRSVVAQVDSGRPASARPAPAPRRIALFFDASGSAAERDLERERALLRDYLGALGSVEVALVAFRDAADAPRRFRISNGDAVDLLQALADLPMDGGSSYAAIDLGNLHDIDQVLVMGDGLSNFGGREPQLRDAGGRTPVLHVIHAAQGADHAALQRLAQAGGGQLIDLLQLDAAQALARLREPGWRLLAIATDGAECVELLPRAGAAVGPSVTVTARCRGEARLTLRFGETREKALERSLVIGHEAPLDAALADSVHRLRAQAWIAELESQAQPDAGLITELGTRYAVVTRHTSLLVLDRIEDYLRYRIEPKEADLRADYLARLPDQPKPAPDSGRAQRIESLRTLWREYRDWHGQRHAWLETLLQPTADAEALQWAQIERAAGAQLPPDLRKAAAHAASLAQRSAALMARWSEEGADPEGRAAWEREASGLMIAVDALRAERARLPEALAEAARAAASRADDEASLDRVEVTGSRISSEERAAGLARRAAPSPVMMPSPAPAPVADHSPVPQSMAVAASGAPGSASAGASANAAPAPARIRLSGWNPDTPYIAALRAAADPYRAYLAEREVHGRTPAFFLDAADFFRTHAKQPELAQRVLSNLAELDVENTSLTRVLAYRLAQWDLHALASGQFEQALRQRPEEPQSYRDLALALARMPQPDLPRAIGLLWRVATDDWHGRFPDIELIALHEINDLLSEDDGGARRAAQALGIPDELLSGLALGLRVSLSWDADNTDIDLWVIDPSGDAAYYGQSRTRSGGHVSRDFTQGYGPEVFGIARPLPGTYRVRAHYFGDRRQSLTGPVTVQLEFDTGFGRAGGQREALTLRLETGREWIDVGEFAVGVVGD